LSSLAESDKELLNEIQWTFPLVTRPFDTIAKKFDTTPEIIKEKLNNLKEIGVLRQLSAIFDTRKLGYISCNGN
jgi:DNA-binding Lrp family transcriptional regulator